MSIQDGWLLTTSCEHCGGQLESRPKTLNGGTVIKGLEPMEYRHAIDGKRECVRISTARPYSDWGQYEIWKSRIDAARGKDMNEAIHKK